MIYTIIYKLSKQYTQDEKIDKHGNKDVVQHYFYQKPLILLVAGSIIYFLCMNVDAFQMILPFYSLVIPVDLYLLNREIEQDKETYRTNSLITLDEYDMSQIVENPDDKTHSSKLYYMATLIYEYITNKKNAASNPKHKKNTTTKIEQISADEFIETNYEPDTMNLCKTMEHTLDNILNNETI